MHFSIPEVPFDLLSCKITIAMTDPIEEASRSGHRSFFAHETLSATCMRFNATHIFVANINGIIDVYDIDTGQPRNRLVGHTSGVYPLQCTSRSLVSGSSDCTIRIWDLKTMKLRHILRGHQATVRTIHILDQASTQANMGSESGYQIIVTGSGDSTIRVWRLPNEDANAESSSEAALTAQVPVVSSCHDSRTTNSAEDHFLLHTCRGHSAAITVTAVQGGKCVSGSVDKTVRIWDVGSGTCEHILEGHTDKSKCAQPRFRH